MRPVVGRWLIGKVIGLMQAAMNRNNVDPTLTKYLGSIIAIALNITLALGILGYFGIQTTSFAAMLAGAGVARPVRRVERTAQLAGGVDALDAIARLKAAVAQIMKTMAA